MSKTTAEITKFLNEISLEKEKEKSVFYGKKNIS